MNTVHPQCVGELCALCGAQAEHKVAEEFFFEGPLSPLDIRHPHTAYVCGKCFRALMHGSHSAPESIPLSARVESELLRESVIRIGPVMRIILSVIDGWQQEIERTVRRLEKTR